MSTVLILSEKPLIAKKEEDILAAEGLQIANSSTYSLFNEYSIRTGKLVYSVIVIDDTVRGLDSIEACRKLRTASKAPILLLGKRLSIEMWEQYKDVGFNQYYKKPVSSEQLAGEISKAARDPESLKYSATSATYAAAPQPTPAATYQPTPTVAYQPTPMAAPQPAPMATPQPTPAATYKPTPEAAPQPAPVVTYQPAPVTASQPASAVTPKSTSAEDCQPVSASAKTSDNMSGIWRDPKVANLINGFVKGKIKEITPEINLGFNEGFSYHEVETLMGTKGKETVLILENLAKQGLLIKKDFEKILASPDGEVQLIPMETCPNCESNDLARGQLVEHFACGHIGLEEEFAQGFNQVCPKCHRELKLIGTDYRKPGLRYVCNSCHGIFPAPTIKNRSIKTGKVYPLEQLHYINIYSYTLNETYRQKLEFEMEPKKQLIDYLIRLGYKVQETAEIQGRSGATHKIDIVATMDDLITNHTVAIGILAAANNDTDVTIDPLFNFDSRIYDTGIDGKMVIAIPRFTAEAMKFAERQGIRVYNLPELRDLLSWKIQVNQMIDVNGNGHLAELGSQPENGDRANPRAWLKWHLQNKGYTVEEKLKVTGRSGAEHTIDFFAQKDDGIISHKIAACVITGDDLLESDTNEVMQFDTAAYDTGIRDKVLICTATLSKEARQFAQYQRIKIIEARQLVDFSVRRETNNVINDARL
jgi:CheY-like chemotaxis protein